MGKLYVAYGSNLNLSQMAYRCPSARIYGAGQLNNWELVYRGSMVMVDTGKSKKKAMVDSMDRSRMPGKPSASYIETIRKGYLDNDLDMSIFEESLRKNKFECS